MKGRNPRLIELRNQYLIKRFYYWYDVQRIRRDDALFILSEQEIFLDQDYISRVISDNDYMLKEIRANFKGKIPSEKQIAQYNFTGVTASSIVQLAVAFN